MVKWFFALLIGIAGFLVYILINLVLVYSSVYIITNFAPTAAGSGILEIKGYLNGVDTLGILLSRTLIVKVFGSSGSVGGGLAIGKEGPLVHTGACIASLLGQGGTTEYHLSSRWLQVFKSDRDRCDLVTCGCAAGVSAAFRALVGGVLFVLEEVTAWKGKQVKIIEACLVSVITSIVSFGFPLLRKCNAYPEADPDFETECPKPPGIHSSFDFTNDSKFLGLLICSL